MNHAPNFRSLREAGQFLCAGLTIPVFLFLVSGAGAEGDDIIPQPYPVERYEPIWKKSPFTLSSAVEADNAGFGDKLKLMGVLKIGDQPYVSLYDSENKVRFLVSNQPDEHGIKLESLQGANDLSQVQVKLNRNGEIVTLRYDLEYLKQASIQSAGTPQPNTIVKPQPVPVASGGMSIPPAPPPAAVRPPITRRIIIPSQPNGS